MGLDTAVKLTSYILIVVSPSIDVNNRPIFSEPGADSLAPVFQ